MLINNYINRFLFTKFYDIFLCIVIKWNISNRFIVMDFIIIAIGNCMYQKGFYAIFF